MAATSELASSTCIAAFRDQQRTAERGKILHVRAEDDRFVREDRFDRILSADRRQALAHENNRGDGEPETQFAGRIQQKAIDRLARWCFDFRTEGDAKPQCGQALVNFARTLDVTRRDD